MIRPLGVLLLLVAPVFAGPGEEVDDNAYLDALKTEPVRAAPPALKPRWQATRAAESPSARAFRRLAAYAGGTVIILTLGASFWLYGVWYRRKTIAIAQQTPLLRGPGHGAGWPPTPAA